MRALRGVAVLALVAAAAAAAYPPASAPARPGYRVLFSGSPPSGGHWNLSARKRTISGLPSLCLSFTTRTTEGLEFSSNGCGGGSMRAWNNVFPVSTGYGGGSLHANLVAGFTVARARKAVITFVDRKRVTVSTRLGPPAFRRALGEPIRFFVANAYTRTKAAARWVSVFDSRGRRIGRSKLGA